MDKYMILCSKDSMRAQNVSMENPRLGNKFPLKGLLRIDHNIMLVTIVTKTCMSPYLPKGNQVLPCWLRNHVAMKLWALPIAYYEFSP